MLAQKKITIIGGGNLGSSIAAGLIESGKVPAGNVHVTRRNFERLNDLKEKGAITSNDNKSAAASADIILLAIKPYHVEKILKEIIIELHPDQILVCLATGITLADLHTWVPGDFFGVQSHAEHSYRRAGVNHLYLLRTIQRRRRTPRPCALLQHWRNRQN